MSGDGVMDREELHRAGLVSEQARGQDQRAFR